MVFVSDIEMQKRKGLVIVNTGDGKGKTTAALGIAVRAWGDGMRVLILQFIKGGWKYGELNAIKALGDINGKIKVSQCGIGFSQRDDQNEEEHKKAAANALAMAHREIKSGEWDVIILDEINYAVKFGLIDKNDVIDLLNEKSDELHVILTGRDAVPEIVEKADLVTEMRLIKHPFKRGIKAQKGIEF